MINYFSWGTVFRIISFVTSLLESWDPYLETGIDQIPKKGRLTKQAEVYEV